MQTYTSHEHTWKHIVPQVNFTDKWLSAPLWGTPPLPTHRSKSVHVYRDDPGHQGDALNGIIGEEDAQITKQLKQKPEQNIPLTSQGLLWDVIHCYEIPQKRLHIITSFVFTSSLANCTRITRSQRAVICKRRKSSRSSNTFSVRWFEELPLSGRSSQEDFGGDYVLLVEYCTGRIRLYTDV